MGSGSICVTSGNVNVKLEFKVLPDQGFYILYKKLYHFKYAISIIKNGRF
jgi:hypothetical protein